ncbi:MAG: hypothetical protein AAF281_13630 [Pseudomonadota bacterium]
MHRKRTTLALAATLLGSPAVAGADFGSAAEAQAIAAQMSEIIRSGGIDAGIAAMHDPAQPFGSSRLGIHVFENTIIVADNREPELIATSYAEVQDLTEETMWPRIVAAADAKGDAMLKWYHYDTEAVYEYRCYSERAVAPSVLVMVCR